MSLKGADFMLPKYIGNAIFDTLIANSKLSTVYGQKDGNLACKVVYDDKIFETEFEVYSHMSPQLKNYVTLPISFSCVNKYFIFDQALCCMADNGRMFRELNCCTKMRFMRHLANGLHLLHQSNIAHRDIKLENILIFGNDLKYCDFGLSFIVTDHIDVCSGVSGTRAYIAPELYPAFIAGSKVSNVNWFAADIWNLGCVFYMLITGLAIPWFKKADAPRNCTQLARIDDPFFSKIITLMLCERPEGRPSAADITTMLES